MTISPKASMIYSVLIAILGVIAAGVLPSYVPAGVAKEIAETAAYAVSVLSAIQTALHALSAPQAGPFVPASKQ